MTRPQFGRTRGEADDFHKIGFFCTGNYRSGARRARTKGYPVLSPYIPDIPPYPPISRRVAGMVKCKKVEKGVACSRPQGPREGYVGSRVSNVGTKELIPVSVPTGATPHI